MDLLYLRSLLAVADSGAITEAADRLGLTQPALSRRLQQLEEHLGATLFTRGRKGAELTEAGRIVDMEARHLVARYDQLRQQVRALQRLEGGTVRIGGGATAVTFVLPAAIAEFQADHPEIRFHVTESGSQAVARDVSQGRLELGLVTLPVQARELNVTPLLSDHIVLVARKDHPLAQRTQIKPEELAELPFVGFEAGTAVRRIIDETLRRGGVEMNVVMELRSIPAILRMVSTTGYPAFISQLGAGSQEDVVEIPVNGLNIARQLAVVTRKGSHPSPAANAFLGHLTERTVREK